MTKLTLAQIENDELLRVMVENTPDQIYLATTTGYLLGYFPGNDRLFDVDYSHAVGKHIRESFAPKFCDLAETVIAAALEKNTPQWITYPVTPNEIFHFKGDVSEDEEFWFEARALPLHLNCVNEPLIMWISRDVTIRVRLVQEIQMLVDRVDLTGLFNRRRFMSNLTSAFTRFKRYQENTCVVMIDIDNFKECNDRLGHLAGDDVIRHVANICTDEIRETDTIGRLGGEEFAVILPHTDLQEATKLSERLRLKISNAICYPKENEPLTVTVSIGISQFINSDVKMNMVLSRADKAMYLSKQQGKNQTTLHDDILNCA